MFAYFICEIMLTALNQHIEQHIRVNLPLIMVNYHESESMVGKVGSWEPEGFVRRVPGAPSNIEDQVFPL